jgi:hypothetical protein
VSGRVASSWDAEYSAGRYRDEAPVDFGHDILATAHRYKLSDGLYIGCGNGRNLLPLADAGLDLIGLDVSAEAIAQLRRRRPALAAQLVVGDLSALPAQARYDVVIGIQVFQHGIRREAHRHLGAAAYRVSPGGLLCIRVNATETEVVQPHERLEDDEDGSFTVRYTSGPKAGLDVHFFTGTELGAIVGSGFDAVLAPRLHATTRSAPESGKWSQWEAIWRRRAAR